VFLSNKDIIKSFGYKAFLEITLKPQFVPIGGIGRMSLLGLRSLMCQSTLLAYSKDRSANLANITKVPVKTQRLIFSEF
jgi:hypothetical protein